MMAIYTSFRQTPRIKPINVEDLGNNERFNPILISNAPSVVWPQHVTNMSNIPGMGLNSEGPFAGWIVTDGPVVW